ncbi:MAG: glycoside hydrolase family 3 C-terminal domain-containing protein [Sphingomonadales bacterium]|nr:glycoside hydrolase family 3 C-terminal domain-containing protein [Sphingomonadales bacterium]
MRAGEAPEMQAQALYERLSNDERLGLLDGDSPFWPGLAGMMGEGYNIRPYVHGAVDRLGVPGIRFIDGPRGCVAGRGTAFPAPMARGATWDLDLEERVGEVIGREVRAQGGNFFGGVCINLPRHPSWGRAQETYGDDPFHLGEFGAALTRGTQKYVMACAKHYALNSMENARFKVDVEVDEADLHDVYLPHFKRVVDEGVAGIMSAYNSVNGEWAGQNRYLLTTVLRDQWRWPGVTVSDFIWGLRDAGASLAAGLDLEEPFAQQRAQHLRDDLAAGKVGWEAVQRSGVRLLAAQLRSYAGRAEVVFGADIMANDEARGLSREVAARAMVLLKNEPVAEAPLLPLAPEGVTSIALIGRLATRPNMGDAGSSNVRPPSFVTPLEGLRAAFPRAEIQVVSEDDPQAAAAAAASAQVAIVVAGYDKRDEGEYVDPAVFADPVLTALYPPLPPGTEVERTGAVMTDGFGGDRASLTLRPIDEAIIKAVAAANPRTVVSIVTAGAVLMEAWRREAPAILIMWYAGMEGGHALADVLTGRQNPSGRLPYSIPTQAEHLPAYERDATRITYGRLHGQRLLDELGVAAAYPHGFGLSYTRWSIGGAELSAAAADGAMLAVEVANLGERDGRHVVQVYGRTITSSDQSQRALLGFAGVDVVAGATARVEVAVSYLPLARWDRASAQRILPRPEDVLLEVGAHAHDPQAIVLRGRR